MIFTGRQRLVNTLDDPCDSYESTATGTLRCTGSVMYDNDLVMKMHGRQRLVNALDDSYDSYEWTSQLYESIQVVSIGHFCEHENAKSLRTAAELQDFIEGHKSNLTR